MPEIVRLQDAGDYRAASRLIRRAETVAPDDPVLRQASLRTAMPLTVTTTPPGAEVWATGFAPDDEDWVRLGTTPFTVTPAVHRVLPCPGAEAGLRDDRRRAPRCAAAARWSSCSTR